MGAVAAVVPLSAVIVVAVVRGDCFLPFIVNVSVVVHCECCGCDCCAL